jgi:hypothetical protein
VRGDGRPAAVGNRRGRSGIARERGLEWHVAGGNLRYATALDDTWPVNLTASVNDLGNRSAAGARAKP